MTSSSLGFNFPRVSACRLENFSLYGNAPTIDVTFDQGVFCLAGANGLGKSTFLAALNYGLTGRVAQPSRSFRSSREYYDDSRAYTQAYFTGRIAETDREAAQVSVSFAVGDFEVDLTRGLFEPDQLRQLAVKRGGAPFLADEVQGGAQLHAVYADLVAEATGLGDFRQFAFLQLFLLTFDERRELLFWNELIAEQVLYLAFGVDPSVGPRAEELRRKDEGLESQARNQQYIATQAVQRLKQLRPAAGDDSNVDDLRQRYDALLASRDEAVENLSRVAAELDDARLEFAAAAARRSRALDDYEETFARVMAPPHNPTAHPVVVASVTEGRCELCGHVGSHVAAALSAAALAHACPLCRHDLADDVIVDTTALGNLQAEVDASRSEADSASQKVERVAKAHSSTKGLVAEIGQAITSLESQAGPALAGRDPDLLARIDQLERERVTALERRDEYRRERDEARQQFRALRATLSDQYSEAEIEFVPLFKDLAESFLGLEIDIQMRSKAESFGFVLSVEGQTRRALESLSESQRFFVDIALRMALAKYMSTAEAPATMFIDTPEGSLDIAYEAQAGEMFAAFAVDGFSIIMTANINTSQLLLQLAGRCGAQRMQLRRMTEWAELSAVQARSEELFDDAFGRIEAALIGGAAT
jgi:DNA repair exonuclease SbcCD ATPase subunit